MKKALKRGLSLLLAITIIFGSMYVGLSEVDFGGLFVVKAQAVSVDDLTFTLNDDGVSYSVTDCNPSASGDLVIPETYNNLPVTNIGVSAFEQCDSLISIKIPNSITTINASNFYGCNSLTSVNLPDTITSIGQWAFYSCDSLTSITFPDSLTSIGRYAFYGCTNLTSVKIPDNVTTIGDCAFRSCTRLKSVSIGNSLTSIDNSTFAGCMLLTSITIPDNITSISYQAFKRCLSLTSIIIPNSVTSIASNTFVDCNKLTIYGFRGSYAETYAKEKKIPFKTVDDFGYAKYQTISEGGTQFDLYNKNAWLEHDDVLGLVSDDKNITLYSPTVEYNGISKEYPSNNFIVNFSNLSYDITVSVSDFQKYIIPKTVAESIKKNSVSAVSVYMTQDRKDDNPYVSTVFGRIHDEDCENTYEELQTNSLNIYKDKTYDVIVTVDLKGEKSATYYLSQDINHRIPSATGVFSAVDIYSKFDVNKPVYAYAVTNSGKVTEPVSINLKKIVCSEATTNLLSASKVNLLGSTTTGITISDSIPIIGGTELSMSLVELPIGIEIEGERVRISIGRDFYKYSTENGKEKENEWISFKECCKEIDKEMKSGKDVKDKYNAFEKAKKQRGFGKNNIKTDKKSGLSFDASYMGYIEGYFIDGNIVFTDFCGSVAAEFIAQYTVNGSIGPVPAYFYVKGGINGAFSLDLARQIPDINIPFQFDATIALTPNAKIGGGVGTKGVASAGIYGTLSIPTVLEIMDKHLTLSIAGSVGVEGEILFWSGKKELISGSWKVLDKFFGSSKKSMGGFSEAVYSEMSELVYSDAQKVEYSLASRDYVKSTSDWVGYPNSGDLTNGIIGGMQEPLYSSGIMSGVTVTELQTSVYKNSQTQLVQFGDKIMLAYIEDCAERDTYNRYRLMYTTYTPSTNTWTQPKAVCDSGKMDISPSLATDGENVYIAWQTINTNPTDVTEEELYNALNNVEIYSAKYDSASDSFINVTQHTSNNTYDYSPYVTVENGSATVYWVNAESLDYAVGKMSIHSSKIPSNTLVYGNLNYITTLKAFSDEISYSMDVDGNLNTVNDIKLFTNGVQVGEDIVYDTAVVTNFAYGDFNGTETLFYSDGGTVYYIENGESVVAFSDDGGIADSLLINNLNGKPAIIYTQLTDMGSELRISTFENDTWSKPVYLTDIGCSLSNVDAVSVNGKVYAVFDRTQTTVATDEVTGDESLEYSQTDLCMLTSEGYYDLEISNIGYDEDDVSIGSSVPFIVVMENKGTQTINSVKFTVSDTLGYSKTITKDVNLAPGAIESVELEYFAQESYTACDLTVTATIVGEGDIDTNNNTTSEKIGRTDISVGTISTERIGDIYKINCEVINDSLLEAENVKTDISFGFYKKEVVIGTMTENSSYIVELLVAKNELVFDEYDVCTLTFSATTDSEEIVLGNNENTVTVDNSEKLVEHEHNLENDVCDGCGLTNFSYETSDDGITITGYNGTNTEILIPEVINDVSVVAISASAFIGNTSLTSVVISDSVESIGGSAFSSCTSLLSITIGDSVTSIDSNAFSDCTNLEKVYWNAKEVTGLTFFSNIFSNAGKSGDGIEIVFGNTVEKIPAYLCYVILPSHFPKITSVIIGENVTSIGESAFNSCINLTSIIIPDCVTNIGANAFNNTRYYNNEINWDNDTLYINNHFIKAKETVSGIYEIKEGTKSIAVNAFEGCTSLTSVTVPDSVTNIGKNAFAGCTSLEYAIFSETEIKDISKYFSFDDETVISTSSSVFVGTGDVVTVDGDFAMEFECVVRNDTNGDGVCDALDAMQVGLVSNGHRTLDGAYALAADSNADDIVDANDYQAIVNKAVA